MNAPLRGINAMRLIKEYKPPHARALMYLKESLGYTGEQMADLAGVASNSQWRKYTSISNPRNMSAQMLFFIAAQLELSPEQLKQITARMEAISHPHEAGS